MQTKIDMSLTISVTGKIPGVLQNLFGNFLKKYVNFIFVFIQRKHFGVPYDASKVIPHNEG